MLLLFCLLYDSCFFLACVEYGFWVSTILNLFFIFLYSGFTLRIFLYFQASASKRSGTSNGLLTHFYSRLGWFFTRFIDQQLYCLLFLLFFIICKLFMHLIISSCLPYRKINISFHFPFCLLSSWYIPFSASSLSSNS